MTNNDIQQLIDKYLNGETSPAEEQMLALELSQRQEMPEEWQAVRLMLGELAIGEAEYDAIIKQRSHKQDGKDDGIQPAVVGFAGQVLPEYHNSNCQLFLIGFDIVVVYVRSF